MTGTNNVLALLYQIRERVRTDAALKGKNPDRLTLTALGMKGVKAFYEGYYGAAFTAKMKEGARLRVSDPKAYEQALEGYQALTFDLRGIRQDMRLVERLTTSDLSYGIGAIRDAEINDPRPAFRTDLFDIVYRRTRNDLSVIRTNGGVELARQFLNVRAEGTVHSQNSWVGSGENYSMMNLEDGFELTWEALMGNQYDEWLGAMRQLGENARRTRAWLVVDAVRRSAEFLELPDAGQGPTINNLDAVNQYLASQIINGQPRPATVTDLFVPTTYRSVAARALATTRLQAVGGASDPVDLVAQDNPVYQAFELHSEEILVTAPVTAEQAAAGQSNRDYIAADRSLLPVEFSVLAGFEAGARVLTKISDIEEGELERMGSFDEHVIETKVSDVAAAHVRNPAGVVLVRGS